MNKVILMGRLTRDDSGYPQSMPETDEQGFMNIPDGINEELPFN